MAKLFTQLLTEAEEAKEEKVIPTSPLSTIVNRYISMMTGKSAIRPKVDGNVDFKQLWDAYVNKEDGADIQWRRLLTKGLGVDTKNVNIRDNSPNQVRDRFVPELITAFGRKLSELASADSTSVNAQVKFELIGVIYSLLIILKSGSYFNAARTEVEQILKDMVANNKEENLYGLELVPRNVAGLELKLQKLKDAKRV
jgi:hypothetical protein